MAISDYMAEMENSASLIRKMFEEGIKLKQQFGNDNVFDFSIGNPVVPPTKAFKAALLETAEDPNLSHGYMPNPGYADVREIIAKGITCEQGVTVTDKNVIMTCGAAGALNIFMKAVINPGDEVIIPVPCFMEYKYYCENVSAKAVFVPTAADFDLDVNKIVQSITAKTKIILLNSPNNPTGKIYSEGALRQLADVLVKQHPGIFLLCDEPYHHLSYGKKVPGIFSIYPNAVVATSYSKDMSLPGERIGYLAINPNMTDAARVFNAATVANRILGFINAGAFIQKVCAKCYDQFVDVSIYEKKRDLLAGVLAHAGYQFDLPEGAFYFFVKSPIADDVGFCDILRNHKILAVPGKGFSYPGFFRLAYCCSDTAITGSAGGFQKAIQEAGK
ncbi:MAG: pyridoxal phosphate-dependent aminotransferase [Lactobacillales bacterium]|jgi:aspartate aminotransferase|nr:pyridoxal phosphate-dependent aminotransferase [Lactobacillales bacterium]